MRDGEYLSPEEADRWKTYPLELSSRQDFGEVAPYFVEWIRQQLYARFGRDLYEEGYRVYTTLDPDLQKAAVQAVEKALAFSSAAFSAACAIVNSARPRISAQFSFKQANREINV